MIKILYNFNFYHYIYIYIMINYNDDKIKLKYLKYKEKYLKLKKLYGGNITKNEFIDNKNYLGPYYPYAIMFKNNIIKNIEINDSKCLGDITKINLLASGANGFALSFECIDNKIFVVKFRMELAQSFGYNPADDIISTYKKEIIKEYSNINKFNNSHILKAYNYFLFQSTFNQDTYDMDYEYNIYDNKDKIEQIKLDNYENIDYKYENIIPFHGGIILEYVKYPFDNKIKCVNNLKIISTLFLGYLSGINHIYETGYIHKDIKEDNIMYNKINEDYQSKIIDIGEVYCYTKYDGQFYPANQETIFKQYFIDLGELTKTEELFNKNIDKIKHIAGKYDLYAICFVFNKYFINLIKQNKDFIQLINNVLSNNDDYNITMAAKLMTVYNYKIQLS